MKKDPFTLKVYTQRMKENDLIAKKRQNMLKEGLLRKKKPENAEDDVNDGSEITHSASDFSSTNENDEYK